MKKGWKKKKEFLRKIAKKKDVIIDEMGIKEKKDRIQENEENGKTKNMCRGEKKTMNWFWK